MIRKYLITLLVCFNLVMGSCAFYGYEHMQPVPNVISEFTKSRLAEADPSVVSVDAPRGYCSGFIGKRNYVVTAAHCATMDETYWITFADGSKSPAFIAYVSDTDDWAILRTNTRNFPPVHFANSWPQVGQMVSHIRSVTLDDGQYHMWGVYSGFQCDMTIIRSDDCLHWMAMPAVGGDSGGPVFNDNGEVIGIMSRGYIFAPMAMAVPVDYAEQYLSNL